MIDIKERLLERMRDRSIDYTDYLLHMISVEEVKRLTEKINSLQVGVRMSEVIEPSPEKMLKADEAYRFLGMPRSTFYRNVKLGHLPQPYYITHGSPRWKLGELEVAKRGVRNAS